MGLLSKTDSVLSKENREAFLRSLSPGQRTLLRVLIKDLVGTYAASINQAVRIESLIFRTDLLLPEDQQSAEQSSPSRLPN